MAAITVEHLTHVYSPGTPFEKTAVEDVNLEIEEGEFVGVIGHTGSGKSTLIQHFNGLLRPTSGRILVEGRDMWADPKKIREFRFMVGLVFQYPEYQLFEETVAKDIAFGPTNMGLSPEEVQARVELAARFVGLGADKLDKSPFELSGGQKRRVAIAGVMAMEPRVLILDEPTAGLDPRGRDKVLGEIQQYHRERGNTVLLVSHSMEDVAKYADRVLVMNRSRVAMFDTVERVFARADEIEAMDLAVPQVTNICKGLAQRGVPIDPHCYTIAQAKAQLLALRAAKGGCANA